ncbi:zinc-binding dehydrogenase [Streptomyces sp. NPDC047023]|uniref:zinc-binding dehydrogenase n=1 Tax=Streptomyces sp. NPDC047023 TaxID=3155139 RepID=UPI0033E538B3
MLDQLGLPAGATVLVNGVGGGVGLAVARLAVARGLRVIGTGNTAKREHAEGIGVQFIDYTAGPVTTAARELLPGGFDGIVDLVGGTSLRTVAPLAHDPSHVVALVHDLGGRFVERRVDRKNLERSARLALDGVLEPVITAVHPLSEAPAALATVENGHASGKVVVKVA